MSSISEQLLLAIEINDLEKIKYLIEEQGVDINTRFRNGNTPLHWACLESYNLETIKYLVEHGAGINTRNNNGETPLHWACKFSNNLETVKYLVEHGANINIRNITGLTPFNYASGRPNNSETINYLKNPTQLQPRRRGHNEPVESPFFRTYESGDTCGICIEELSNGYPICVNKNCTHGFHCGCINEWLERKSTCPVCRERFDKVELSEMQQSSIQNMGFGKRKLSLKQIDSYIKYLISS